MVWKVTFQEFQTLNSHLIHIKRYHILEKSSSALHCKFIFNAKWLYYLPLNSLFNTKESLNIGTVAIGLKSFSSWNCYLQYNAFIINISFWITFLHIQLKRFVVYFAFATRLMKVSFHLFCLLTHPWNFCFSLNKGFRDYLKMLLD